ncbi:BrnT family toxin [uncultured Aquincola sp.]|uniref:BrnT family toxin n=1 Tax=uncultured Aquincola sp. TaxID=886556 RepID=UPI0032B0FE7D
MRITYDPAKNDRNVRLRGLSFDTVAHFNFDSAVFAVDDRKDHPETRFVALGLLGDRVHVLCFTETSDGIRVISFRKANPREVKRYDQARSTDSP